MVAQANGGEKKRRESTITQVTLASLAHSTDTQEWSKYNGKIHQVANGTSHKLEEEEEKQSPWFSLWLSNVLLLMCGMQFSIYFMSMWPYLSGLDKDATLTFLGWIIASYSVGQALASPLFGLWNQKAMSTKHPVALGCVFSIVGNLVYALLPTIAWQVRWLMLASRVLIGLGSGNYAVLRNYTSSASTLADRNKAVALATGSYVLGISLGPGIQSAFIAIGEKGFWIFGLQLNMYTWPAYAMVVTNIVAFLLIYTAFNEEYIGIISKEDRAAKTDEYFVLPKFDYIGAAVCIYLFFLVNSVSTVIETLSSPIGIALYQWNDSEAVLYSGISQIVCCIFSLLIYGSLAYTRLGKVDGRYQMMLGIILFAFYHIIILPWPFFHGKLAYIVPEENGQESTENMGGCYARFEWCKTLPQIPLPLYLIGYVIGLGFAFPFVANPIGTVFSEIIGPRNQGNMQGIMALFGSLARMIAPILTTALFESSGYTWPMVIELVICGIAALLVLVFWRRLVPLKIEPEPGKALKYKNGTFYKL